MNLFTRTESGMVSFKHLVHAERFSDPKYFFRIQKIGWKFIGFWPGRDKVSSLKLALAIANGLEVLIYCAFQLNFCYENQENLVMILDTLTPAITQFTSAMKIFFIVWNRHEILAVLNYLRESFESGNKISLSLIDFYSQKFFNRFSEKAKRRNSWNCIENRVLFYFHYVFLCQHHKHVFLDAACY